MQKPIGVVAVKDYVSIRAYKRIREGISSL